MQEYESPIWRFWILIFKNLCIRICYCPEEIFGAARNDGLTADTIYHATFRDIPTSSMENILLAFLNQILENLYPQIK